MSLGTLINLLILSTRAGDASILAIGFCERSSWEIPCCFRRSGSKGGRPFQRCGCVNRGDLRRGGFGKYVIVCILSIFPSSVSSEATFRHLIAINFFPRRILHTQHQYYTRKHQHRTHKTMSALTTKFRTAMSSLASPVMILTTPSFTGVTLSSVTSLSINPDSLIQFNLMNPSTTSTSLHRHGLFALHLLKPTYEAGILARSFGKNGHFDEKRGVFVPVSPFDGLVKGVDYNVMDVSRSKESTEGVGLPVLNGGLVERVLLCKRKEVFEVQDHEIWVGKVWDVLEFNEGLKSGGLLNFDRAFHKVGDDELE